MKKTLAILMAALMLAAFTACGGAETAAPETEKATEKVTDAVTTEALDSDTAEATDAETPAGDEAVSALTAFETVWAAYPEQFSVFGGGYVAMADGVPGPVDLSDTDAFTSLFHTPADYIGKLDDAASLFHAMNTNNFTGVIYHFADAVDVEGFITAAEAELKAAQWMCGQPEVMTIATLDDSTVVVLFGLTDVINTFDAVFAENYASYTVVVNGPVVE